MSSKPGKQRFVSKLSPKSFQDVGNFSKSQLVSFVFIFGSIGGIILFHSFAASSVVASVQAEKLALPAGARIIQDGGASAGQAARVTTNGQLKGSVVIPSSTSSLSVIARGSNCYGGWPWVAVSVDGKSVLKSTKVGTGGWKSLAANSTIAVGTHTITVTASNNGRVNSGCSRHLDVDLVTFFGSTAPPTNAPTIALSASPATVTAGSASILTWTSSNATACVGSGSWTGPIATSGTRSTGALNTAATYTLVCTGASGSATATARVAVNTTTNPNPPPPNIPPAPVPPTPPASGTVGVPYTCSGPVNGVHVVGTGSDGIALVNLKSGCTGSLSFDIHITSGGGDGVKVQGGAHDLSIGPSTILCDPSPPTFHEDGVQVQGGTNVTFHNLKVVCPSINGQGAGAFYINGADFGPITNVICDGCNLEHTHGGVTYNQGSGHPHPVNSGARNSILHNPHPFLDYTGGATGFLNENNTIAPVCTTLANC